ncbi:MAG: SRPBCC domain-containing protein [Acidobacteriota bacterium]
MTARTIDDHVDVAASPDVVFAALLRPSSIQAWWSASRVIVVPRLGGAWAVSWGDDADRPDYTFAGILRGFEPERRLFITDASHHSKDEPPDAEPLEADITTEFLLEEQGSGTRLRLVQAGFPPEGEADDRFAACVEGWKNTLAAIREHVEA